MVVYLYRWKLKPEKEHQFQKAWSYVTEQLREKCGSLGSRLHRGEDGLWYGYAQWPSAEQREAAKLEHKKGNSTKGNSTDTLLGPIVSIQTKIQN